LVRKLLDLINYESHLKKTQQDWETRWENVKELITFASEVETGTPAPDVGDVTPEK
jgi:DNA helicase-2/ATP-dependent DNA helicase PcrA